GRKVIRRLDTVPQARQDAVFELSFGRSRGRPGFSRRQMPNTASWEARFLINGHVFGGGTPSRFGGGSLLYSNLSEPEGDLRSQPRVRPNAAKHATTTMRRSINGPPSMADLPTGATCAVR